MKINLNRDRLYYTITDVAKLLDLKPSIIRFWEKQFIALKSIQKQKNSKRKYRIKDIQYIHKIKNLLYIKKFTIKGAIKQLHSWTPKLSPEEFCDLFYENNIEIDNKSNDTFNSDIVKSNNSVFSQAKIKIFEIQKLLKRLK